MKILIPLMIAGLMTANVATVVYYESGKQGPGAGSLSGRGQIEDCIENGTQESALRMLKAPAEQKAPKNKGAAASEVVNEDILEFPSLPAVNREGIVSGSAGNSQPAVSGQAANAPAPAAPATTGGVFYATPAASNIENGSGNPDEYLPLPQLPLIDQDFEVAADDGADAGNNGGVQLPGLPVAN